MLLPLSYKGMGRLGRVDLNQRGERQADFTGPAPIKPLFSRAPTPHHHLVPTYQHNLPPCIGSCCHGPNLNLRWAAREPRSLWAPPSLEQIKSGPGGAGGGAGVTHSAAFRATMKGENCGTGSSQARWFRAPAFLIQMPAPYTHTVDRPAF